MNRSEQAQKALDDYNTGTYTVKALSEKYGISVGKVYYMLRDAGCEFSRKWRHSMPAETKERYRVIHKGRKFTEEHCKNISIGKCSQFDGMNGYGKPKKIACGYLKVHVPKHPHATKDGYVMLHTVLMERAIGRYLRENEVVHHINHIRDDNRLENLQLMDKHDHMSMHMKERNEKRRNDLLIASSSRDGWYGIRN